MAAALNCRASEGSPAARSDAPYSRLAASCSIAFASGSKYNIISACFARTIAVVRADATEGGNAPAPPVFLTGRAGLSKPLDLPVVQLDVLERRDLRLDFVKAQPESIEIALLDPDAAASALAAEAVMLEQPLCPHHSYTSESDTPTPSATCSG